MLSKIIAIAFESLACGGFWIADSGWTYALWPHRFGSARDCMASFNLAEIALALKSKRPGLKWVRAEIAGREALIVAASLVQLGERIEHVIGQPVGKLLPAEPPARKFEPAPSPRPVSVVDWSGFDPVKFAESLPVHDCAARREGLAKIEAFRAYQAEQPAEAA